MRRSRTFAGNVSEGSTLAEMLAGLEAPAGALVIMDAGIATAANLASLVAQRYRYLVRDGRADGHLFITVLAYQCVQVLRRGLRAAGIHDSWTSLRHTLAVQRRVTARLRRKDGRTLHVRKSTVAEPELMKIYRALALNPAPGGTRKLLN